MTVGERGGEARGECEVRGRRAEVGGRRSEGGGLRPEARGRRPRCRARTEVQGSGSRVQGPRSEVQGPRCKAQAQDRARSLIGLASSLKSLSEPGSPEPLVPALHRPRARSRGRARVRKSEGSRSRGCQAIAVRTVRTVHTVHTVHCTLYTVQTIQILRSFSSEMSSTAGPSLLDRVIRPSSRLSSHHITPSAISRDRSWRTPHDVYCMYVCTVYVLYMGQILYTTHTS